MSLRPALSESQVRELRVERGKGVPISVLARRVKVDKVAVANALYGRSPYHNILDPPPIARGRLEADLPVTFNQVRDMRRAFREGSTVSDLVRQYRVARLTIRKALFGKGPYRKVRDPPPVQPRRDFQAPILSPESVRKARTLRLAGQEVQKIARRLRVDPHTMEKALFGDPPYADIDSPPPLSRDVIIPRAVLSPGQVREVRRLRLTGWSTGELRARYGVSRGKIVDAILGNPPFEDVTDPPPFPPDELERGPAMKVDQVRDIRRLVITGIPVNTLVKRFGVCKEVALRAIYGRPPYDRVTDPPPLVPPDLGPVFSDEQVKEVRIQRLKGVTVQELATIFSTDRGAVDKALFGYPPYDRVCEPPPIIPVPIVRALSKAAVQAARRRRLRGDKVYHLAEAFGVNPGTIRKALYGRPPYDDIEGPPPLTSGDPPRRKVLDRSSVRIVRQRRLRGASIANLAELFDVDSHSIRRALQGIGIYTGITGPPPIPPKRRPGRSDGTPALVENEVQELRRRKIAGASLRQLRQDFGIGDSALLSALHGKKPYESVVDPPPLGVNEHRAQSRLVRHE